MRFGRASGCLPDRRCQAAEASLSPEFTFSFCPGPSLLVQGCARDGRLAPPGICQTLCREEEAVLHDIKACATPRRGGDWRTPDARPV